MAEILGHTSVGTNSTSKKIVMLPTPRVLTLSRDVGFCFAVWLKRK